MEGRHRRRTPIWSWLGSAGLILLTTHSLRAEWLCNTLILEVQGVKQSIRNAERFQQLAEFLPQGSVRLPLPSETCVDSHAVDQEMHNDFQEFRLALTRSALETMMTMFFIRWGSPPPAPKTPKANNSPPPQKVPNTPPPPGGQSVPPGNPNILPPPPVVGTPEPSSIIIALGGAGLASWVAWRKRRRNLALMLGSA